MKDFFVTILICAIIYGCFSYFTHNIHVKQAGKEVQAVVVEKQDEKKYVYIRFKYTVDGREYIKSSRFPPASPLKEGATFQIRYLPEKPEEPILRFNEESLNSHLYYFFVAATVFLLLRFSKLLALSTRPNYE